MKGIAFTLDAIFALVVAVAGVAILLYFQYYPQSPFIIRSTQAQAMLGLLLSTNTSTITGSSAILEALADQQSGSNQVWDQFAGQATKSGSQGIGPTEPFVSNIIGANSAITTGVVADYGNVYFAAGSTLYAVNASGYPVWTKSAGSDVLTTPALYDNMLIYWTSSGISSVSAFNGTSLWSTAISGASPGAAIMVYRGEIIITTTDDEIEQLYPNNGTVYAITTLGSGYGKSIAAASGSIAVMSSTDTLSLLTNEYGASTQGQMWSNSLAADSSGIASYANLIAYGDGTYANISEINGTILSDVNTGSQVSGVAASPSGTIVYQSSTRMTAVSSTGITLWSVSMPSGTYGGAYAGTVPVIGGGEVYSLWSNSYLIAQNLSTGSISWSTRIPYASIGPMMSIAYGRLYVTAGSRILAYGSCNVDPDGSLFQVTATLYLNSQGSCADYILNSIRPMNNYSIETGNVFLPGINLATFNSIAGSYGVTGGPYQTPATLAISFWIYPKGLTGSTQYIIGSNPGNIWSIGMTPTGYVIFNPGSNIMITTSNQLVMGRWQFVTMTATDSFSNISYALYINGIKRTSGTIAGENIQSINNLTFSSIADPLNAVLANVQLYGSFLNATQVGLLYQSGVQGGTLSGADPLSWWPLDGDSNDYGVDSNAAYTTGVSYSNVNYTPQGLIDAYEIGKASTVVPILNYTTQYQNLYNIGVDSWR